MTTPGKRRAFGAPFRAKVALATAKRDRTTAQLASQFGIRTRQATACLAGCYPIAEHLEQGPRLSSKWGPPQALPAATCWPLRNDTVAEASDMIPTSATEEVHRRFLRLFASSEPALRSFIRSLVPTLTDTDDIMQEIAVVLWTKFDQCPSPDDFRPWAFGVARFKVLAWHRDRGRDRHVFDEAAVKAIAMRAEAESDRLAQQRDALAKCLESLAPEHQRLLAAAYSAGAVMKDVARQAGQTPMALYKKLHRIRLLLVECTRRSLERVTP